ncbi:LysR family transcriptional regulator [Corynebacterium sp.]|uniref:LysR family transcriptional regulator n=1 Tax=Corynebacterium sp. TaxID=1720 RepID=UPI0025BD66FA|nr:LysR family transcriptional regulator [Corynebacterium sp.]
MNARLTLESLRYADAVADTGSFSSAARRFGVTQPALSISIAKLEEHLGGRIFLRNPRGTSPTAFGTAVLPRIKQIITDVTRMETEAESFASSRFGTVRVGVSPKIDKSIVGQLKDAVHGPNALATGHDLMLLEAELEPLEEFLQAGSLDMVLVPALGSLPGYTHRLIDSDYLVLVEPMDDDTPATISVDELAERELILCRHGCGITRMVSDMFAEAGHQMKRSEMEVTHCSALPGWADKGMGSVILPERHVRDGMASRRIVREDGTLVEMFYELVWDPGAASAVYLDTLAKYLTTVSPWSHKKK